jgi:ribosomal protein S18 acetylase RimI-like enzyme
VSGNAIARAVPRSLVWATDIDVLPIDHVVEPRDHYLVVRSPGNPAHWWGNFLIFSEPPGAGEARPWERWFDAEFGSVAGIEHRTFAWDRVDGALGLASEEFVSRGYELEETVGLIARPEQLSAHPRANHDVDVRCLDPLPGADRELWRQVVEVQVAARDERLEEGTYREFASRRLDDLRALFRAGHGGWYVALEPARGAVVASCGVVVTGPRARYQAVDTVEAFRRQGICSRLVVEAAQRTAEQAAIDHLVIAADPAYHALGLYESLGFERRERVAGVCQRPGGS